MKKLHVSSCSAPALQMLLQFEAIIAAYPLIHLGLCSAPINLYHLGLILCLQGHMSVLCFRGFK